MTAKFAPITDTQLSRSQLDGLLTDQTVYLDTPGGEAVIHFGGKGTSHARLANGTHMQGRWTLTDTGYCIDWADGPQGSCTRILRNEAGLRMIDDATGDPRGQVSRIVPGNPEGF